MALIDVRLGRFSGLDVVADLKVGRPELLTVVMTAHVGAATAIEALRRGAYDYLSKPFQPSELHATLERCFDRIDLERARASAEAAGRKSQARLRALIDNSLDLIAVIDPSTRAARFVSPSVTGLLGYTQDNGLSRDFFEYVHPEEREKAQDVLDFCVQNEGAIKTVELRLLHINGSWRWFELAARGLLHESAIAGVLICARDVTERRAMEAKLRQVQRLEAVSQLTGGVAHDFNNLLAVIMGNLDLLKREIHDNPGQMQLIEAGMQAAERGATLIRRLLAFARRQTLTPRALDLNELIGNAIELLRGAAGPRIHLEASLAPDLAPAPRDTAQLETALLNLVVNARDAMPDGGRIEIATSNVRLDGDQEVSDGTGEPYIRVSVSDTGSGIAEDVRNHIFEPFFSTKPTGQGTGLGLSTVLGFIEQSGGKIRLASELGAGTSFSLLPSIRTGRLPCPPPDRRGGAPLTQRGHPGGGGRAGGASDAPAPARRARVSGDGRRQRAGGVDSPRRRPAPRPLAHRPGSARGAQRIRAGGSGARAPARTQAALHLGLRPGPGGSPPQRGSR